MPKLNKRLEDMMNGVYEAPHKKTEEVQEEKKYKGYQKIPKELQKKRGRKKKEPIMTREEEIKYGKNGKLQNIDRAEILKHYLENGSNYSTTGEYYGVQGGSIRNILLTYQKNNNEEYNMIKRNYMEEQNSIVQTKSTQLLDDIITDIAEEIKNPDRNYNVTQLGMLYGIIFDKLRLMNGESTQNNAIQIKLSKDLEDLSK